MLFGEAVNKQPSLCHCPWPFPSPQQLHIKSKIVWNWVVRHQVGFTQGTMTVFSSVQSLTCVWLFVTPWTAARQASLSITNSWSLLKCMSIELVMPSNHLILCRPLLLPTSIFPNIRVFSLFQRVNSSHQVAKGLEFQLQHQSFQWIFRTDFL